MVHKGNMPSGVKVAVKIRVEKQGAGESDDSPRLELSSEKSIYDLILDAPPSDLLEYTVKHGCCPKRHFCEIFASKCDPDSPVFLGKFLLSSSESGRSWSWLGQAAHTSNYL